jgi:ribosomal protein S3
MTNFPVFQYIAVLVVVFLLIAFSKNIVQAFKKVKYYFKVRKYRTTRKQSIKLSIRCILEDNGCMISAYITEIKIKGKRVIIYTVRPGIVAGKKGYLIDLIKDYLKSYKIEKVDIKEVNPFR